MHTHNHTHKHYTHKSIDLKSSSHNGISCSHRIISFPIHPISINSGGSFSIGRNMIRIYSLFILFHRSPRWWEGHCWNCNLFKMKTFRAMKSHERETWSEVSKWHYKWKSFLAPLGYHLFLCFYFVIHSPKELLTFVSDDKLYACVTWILCISKSTLQPQGLTFPKMP